MRLSHASTQSCQPPPYQSQRAPPQATQTDNRHPTLLLVSRQFGECAKW
jgi:hypothetical protein